MITKKLSVVTLGFNHSCFTPNEKIEYWIVNDWAQSADEAVSGREQYALFNKVINGADLVFVNLEKTFGFYEIILLHLAYSNRTPIIGVGESTTMDALMAEMVCNKVDNIAVAVAYLENFYI